MDGKEYSLPVAAGLECKIEGSDNGTPVPFVNGEMKEFRVKISEGNPLAPIYPAGWRAELTKKEAADANGYNYTLTVYAPVIGRATVVADNTNEIVVRVNKGTLWAVDKLQVELE